ncbi:hypothetical protein H5T51_05885 [Candidatus Bathyarchaeota archaeon]|nr:hypothetical protein [Candidatus Bathyarchaeota archaeon]
MRNPVFLGVTLSLVLSVFLQCGLKIYHYSYDAFTHMFFADHYRRSWFDLWEPRWYGGFSVTTYPPLTHQLIALLSFSLSVETAYQVMAVASTCLLSFSVYLFSKLLVSGWEARWAILITAVFPSVSLLLNAFGQLPTIFSSALALLAAYAYGSYLKNGSIGRLSFASLLTAAAGAAHHFTFVFFVPATQLIVMLVLARRLDQRRIVITRTLIHVILSVGLLLVTIWPFIEFSLSAPAWTEIPHATRENILLGMYQFPFFWGIYSFTIFLLPMVSMVVFRRRELLPAFAVFLLFFIFGLGGATPLPRLLLGDLWRILTYDRFAFWASMLYIPFLSIIVNEAGVVVRKYFLKINDAEVNERKRNFAAALFLAGLATTYLLVPAVLVLWNVSPKGPLSDHQLKAVADFLNVHSEWKYVTLGFGVQRILLSFMTVAPMLDGGYNLAKTSALFTTTSVETVDGAKYYLEGIDFLRRVLVEGSNTGLRFVVSADPYYDPVLTDFGLKPISKFEGEPAVTVWEIPNVYPSKNAAPKQSMIRQVMWGLTPMLTLFFASVLGFTKMRGDLFEA